MSGFGLDGAVSSGGLGSYSGGGSGGGLGGNEDEVGGLMAFLRNLGMGGGSGGGQGLGQGLGMNIGTAQLGLGGLQSLMGFMGARDANKQAKKEFKFTKDVVNTNLANQIQSYNTALSDRSNARAAMEGRDQASSDRYIEQNKLRR